MLLAAILFGSFIPKIDAAPVPRAGPYTHKQMGNFITPHDLQLAVDNAKLEIYKIMDSHQGIMANHSGDILLGKSRHDQLIRRTNGVVENFTAIFNRKLDDLASTMIRRLFDLRQNLTSPQLDLSRTRLDALEAALEAHDNWLSQGQERFMRHLNDVRDGQGKIMNHLEDVRSRGVDANDRLTEVETWANATKQDNSVAWWGDGRKSRSFWLLVGATCVVVLCAILTLICMVVGCHRLWLKTRATGWRVYGTTNGYQVAARQSSMKTNYY